MENCCEKVKRELALNLSSFLMSKRVKPVFLCVGSDKVVGDLVGVLVGEMLLKKHHINAFVYGSLDYAVTSKNLPEVIRYVKQNHLNSPVIVVDGILGKFDEIGMIKYYPFGSVPGGQFNKGALVGDYSILGVVETSGINSLNFLRSVKLKTVVDVATFIADAIAMAFRFGVGLI